MAKAKAGQKRQQQQQTNIAKKQNKRQKQKPEIPEASPDITHEEDPIIQDNEENDLFANLDEEMDPNGLEDIVQQLEAGSNDSGSEGDDDMEAISEDEQQGQSSEEEEEEEEEEEDDDEDDDDDSEERIKKPASKPKFRDHYMGQITRAFGSDLDKIRQEPTFSVSQLPILINSLESGIDIFSNLEQEIILADAVQE